MLASPSSAVTEYFPAILAQQFGAPDVPEPAAADRSMVVAVVFDAVLPARAQPISESRDDLP